MEVHHHPHAGKKNFKAYVLEFLMIFLAVTLGFFAEGLREHIGEHAREKEYVSSMIRELRYDTAQYDRVMRKIDSLWPMLDSMYMNIKNAARFGYRLQASWNTAVNNSSIPYSPAMPTIQELKNSGSLRLIREKEVAQKIMLYETFVNNTLRTNGESVQDAMRKIFAFEDDYCDYDDFNKKTTDNLLDSLSQIDLGNAAPFEMPLIIKDPVKLNGFANSFVNYKAVSYGYYTQTNHVKKIATDLIILINQKYHFKD